MNLSCKNDLFFASKFMGFPIPLINTPIHRGVDRRKHTSNRFQRFPTSRMNRRPSVVKFQKTLSPFPLVDYIQGVMNLLFTCLIIAQLVVVAAHDWLDIPGIVAGSRVQAVIGRRKLAWATVINCLFPGFAVALAIRFFHAPRPDFALRYWLIYTGITVGSAFVMWWVPYLFGASAKHRELYEKMYAGTRFILPAHRGDRGPNLLHICFHVLFLSTFILALVQIC